MSVSSLKRAAARSAARMSAKELKEEMDATTKARAQLFIGEVKKSPRGTLYRVTTVSLEDLPSFLLENDFPIPEWEPGEPKRFFHYKPEEDPTIPEKTPEDKHRKYLSGFVLGVRKRGEEGDREL